MTEILKLIYSMKKLYDHLCSEIMETYQLTRSELDILLFLHNNPQYDNAKDIVEKRGLSKSHASMGIEHLIKKGYLKAVQDNQDKRKYKLIVLAKAQPIIEDGLAVQQRFLNILFKGFSEEEKRLRQKMFHQMCVNILEEEKI